MLVVMKDCVAGPLDDGWQQVVMKNRVVGPQDEPAPSSLFSLAADAADVFCLQHHKDSVNE